MAPAASASLSSRPAQFAPSSESPQSLASKPAVFAGSGFKASLSAKPAGFAPSSESPQSLCAKPAGFSSLGWAPVVFSEVDWFPAWSPKPVATFGASAADGAPSSPSEALQRDFPRNLLSVDGNLVRFFPNQLFQNVPHFIPASIETIFPSCFSFCASLSNPWFEFACRVSTLGDGAFGHCPSLQSICIPSSVVVFQPLRKSVDSDIRIRLQDFRSWAEGL
jgi:hypothetical protein